MRQNGKSLVSTSRAGLTLMELVVVLVVLAALAAIVVPMFPNILRRAHKVSDATQTSEISKAVQMYQGLYTSYPDAFDLLTDNDKGFPDFLPADGGNVFGGFVTAGNLTSDEVAALRRVGITTAHKFAASTANLLDTPPQPTLNPYPGVKYTDSAVTLSSSSLVALIDPAKNANLPATFMQSVRVANPTARFVLFGVGARSSMVGKVIQDAPTSVPQNKDFTPATLYSRVGVIFMVSGEEVTRTERARFIAAVALEDDELEMTEKDVVGYYQVAQ